MEMTEFEIRRTIAKMLREQERLMAVRSGKSMTELMEQERRAAEAAKIQMKHDAWEHNRKVEAAQVPAKGRSNVKTTRRPIQIVPGHDPKGRKKFRQRTEPRYNFPVEVRRIGEDAH